MQEFASLKAALKESEELLQSKEKIIAELTEKNRLLETEAKEQSKKYNDLLNVCKKKSDFFNKVENDDKVTGFYTGLSSYTSLLIIYSLCLPSILAISKKKMLKSAN